jgi:molecular chaperone GrpE
MNDTSDIDDKKNSESEVIMDDESSANDQLKKLREKLATCVQEKQEYLDGWQRSKADFVNLRKRDEEQKKEFVKFAKEDLIMDILPVLDSFGMAMNNKETWEKVDKNWRNGVEYIFSQLRSTLEKNGLKEVNPVNQKYDPMEHEAIELIKTDDKEKDGVVLEVINKGYSLNDKSIRAPKVKVGEYELKAEVKTE